MANAVVDVDPIETWNGLKNEPNAILVDVRTRAEWSFVGIPNLTDLGKEPILLEWKEFPHMGLNENFAELLSAQCEANVPSHVYFLCRSGVRSLEAAHLMSQVFAARGQDVKCINIAEGFEGDLDSDRHRGETNGWKARGLAWRQS